MARNSTSMISSHLVPACGGTEVPTKIRDVWWLYCWDEKKKAHCYLNLDTSEVVYNREFHPAFHPEQTDHYNSDKHLALCFF